MSNSLSALKDQRQGISMYQPSENQSHLDHLIFEDWATIPMIRIVKVLSSKNNTQKLFSIRSIAVIIGKSVGTVSQAINTLVENGYLARENGSIKLNLSGVQNPELSVQENEHLPESVQKTEQGVQNIEQSVQKTEQKCSEFRTHNINNNINKNINNRMGEATASNSPESQLVKSNNLPTKNKKTIFDLKTSIARDQYQSILDDQSLAAGDRGYLLEQVREMADWSISKGEKRIDWAATLRNWIRRTRKDGVMPGSIKPKNEKKTFRQMEDEYQEDVYKQFLKEA